MRYGYSLISPGLISYKAVFNYLTSDFRSPQIYFLDSKTVVRCLITETEFFTLARCFSF